MSMGWFHHVQGHAGRQADFGKALLPGTPLKHINIHINDTFQTTHRFYSFD